jgi:hypothetical protein
MLKGDFYAFSGGRPDTKMRSRHGHFRSDRETPLYGLG